MSGSETYDDASGQSVFVFSDIYCFFVATQNSDL